MPKSQSATVLPFPQTRNALCHYRTNMAAAGFLSLLLLEREGEAVPGNVQRFDEPNGTGLPAPSPELMLGLLILEALPAKQREQVGRRLRCMAYANPPIADAVRLNNALQGRL